MSWSNTAWQQAEHIYQKIIAMPFIQELIAGTLPQEKFKFYIEQDALYLEQFGRALALIAGRAHQTQHVLDYTRFAEGAIVVESTLHASYFNTYNISGLAKPTPACHYYTSFLLSTAALAQVEVAMAAVLPCFWIYQKVGDYIYGQHQVTNNPYSEWIDTYAGEEFAQLVAKAIDICNDAAQNCTQQQQQAMADAFEMGCQLEWLFWDSAWRMETWAAKLI
ncbi:thiaminase II [Mucilaginibacter paludis]|uniref:Aminopyrimidine aminohydrolase n=1 Tax=Mucilaginibacter paludis DSM 18603 TaxID=714943 RepID=H1Y3N1_9SPHI|nr:thiaminase II [Mucilaginibacter paludis]EHQ30293.1 transcriptional activator, TenA family [Mucilaginibacter paludis DSM 18603]